MAAWRFASTGNPAIPPGTSFYIRCHSGGAQTDTEFETFTLVRPRSDRGNDRARREPRRSPVTV